MHTNRFSYPGTTAQFQESLQSGWMGSLQQQRRPRVLTPEYVERARKKHFCVGCLTSRNVLVKCDFRTMKEKWNYSMYEVEAWVCPACGKQERVWEKVKGKGHSGKDSY